MAGWIWRILKNRGKPNSLQNSRTSNLSQEPHSSNVSSLSSFSPSSTLASKINQSARWKKDYDVCICHSEVDVTDAEELVSYLESQSESLRCFLQLRDSTPGGAIPTELYQAVRKSHCWVMLITKNFLHDPWCKYQMHQALAESPLINGRVIPVVTGLGRKDYPVELRFVYHIDMTDKERRFKQIQKSIINYLEELCEEDTNKPNSCGDTESSLDSRVNMDSLKESEPEGTADTPMQDYNETSNLPSGQTSSGSTKCSSATTRESLQS
ncbi:toll/interleukin-1 receptor domain-containing adapter protein [Latimeria chalumnae]|uniref:TIR domain containing adaptor protein n=1 Tax=Latimeria chalumnae TaxID=7897 RepID=H3BEL2_LATCH|nr:PREDICTED: toll/interleukin-1 receptor domain-containing adapter protein [Latimeria chalumnae]|eukprot:XP_005991219.1 PREDICTED: toll/interleukin-1 receptor domain-containing adapter protein [Latimeria chalumnae]